MALAHEKPTFCRVRSIGDGCVILCSGLAASPKTSEQVRADRVEDVVVIQLEPIDDPEILEEIARQERKQLWIIENRFVWEPSRGMQLGELPEYDTAGFELIHFSQAEFDEMQEEYYREHGHYPDT